MDQFRTLHSTPSDKANSSMHLGCDGNEEFAANPMRWSMSKLGFMQTLNEEIGMLGGGVSGLEESDVHASVGYMGCELKERAGGMSIPGASMYSNAFRGGSTAAAGSSPALLSALQKFLPSNNDDDVPYWLTESMAEDVDFYCCDEFRMYEFKVRRCMRGRSHDWTECPFAHPGEKARRRDPRRCHYSGTACPDFRKGNCRKGDACEYAHGVFECWLHPARYRTQLCKDGKCCTRKVCFFAHTPSQLRLLPAHSPPSRPSLHSHSFKTFLSGSYDGSPLRQAMAGSILDGVTSSDSPGHAGLYDGSYDMCNSKNSHLGLMGKFSLGGFCGASQVCSPTSTLVGHSHSPPPLSPPLSPSESPPMSPNSPSGWNNPLAHRRISCLSGAQVLHNQTAFDSHVALSQVSASFAQSNVPMVIGARGPSPLSSNGPANRRHLERLNSIPTVSAHMPRMGDHSLPSVSNELHSTQAQAMNQLIATLQQLELKDAAEAVKVTGQWPLRSPQFSRSVPVTPNSRWPGQVGTWVANEAGDHPFQKVESGRELRAKIYGRLGKEAPLENEIPDLGWVNELVK